MSNDRMFFWSRKKENIPPGNVDNLDRLYSALLPVESADISLASVSGTEMLIWSGKVSTRERLAIWQIESEPYFRYGCLIAEEIIETNRRGKVARKLHWQGRPGSLYLDQAETILHFMKGFKIENHNIYNQREDAPTTQYELSPKGLLIILGDQIRLRFHPDNRRKSHLTGRLTVTVIPQKEGEALLTFA